jgi:hypothetical protein
VSRPALGPTQPPVQRVPGVLSPGVKRGRGVTLTTHPLLVPRSRISRSYTPLPPRASMACRGTALLFYHSTGLSSMIQGHTLPLGIIIVNNNINIINFVVLIFILCASKYRGRWQQTSVTYYPSIRLEQLRKTTYTSTAQTVTRSRVEPEVS